VIGPLVYLFAGAAAAVAALLVGSAVLIFRHARIRPERADDLRDYLAVYRRVSEGEQLADVHERRAQVMHLTIGDLIRDKQLAVAATQGASYDPVIQVAEAEIISRSGAEGGLRVGLEQLGEPGTYRIREYGDSYLAVVFLSDHGLRTLIATTRAEAREWAERTLAEHGFESTAGSEASPESE
jgi:hypothetical protein